METLNPYEIPLENINLIEASAGTGKSWTVTLLYLRLILEKDLTVDQILVVTYTEAATKELKEKIRERLLDALDAFQDDGYAKADEYLKLKQSCEDLDKAVHALKLAKVSLDESAIFTIHGFCQRTLNEFAFEAALPFGTELLEDDFELMQSITDNFWRRRFYHAPKFLISKFMQKNIMPDSLLADIRAHVGKPYLKLCGPQAQAVDNNEWSELETLFNEVKKLWLDEKHEIETLLLEHGGLNKRSYKESLILSLTEQMTKAFISLTSFLENSKGLDKLGQTKLDSALNKGHEPLNHPFFTKWQSFLNLWNDIDSRSDDALANIRIELLHHLQQELPKEKFKRGVLSFDDLLLQMQKALHNYEPLAGLLRDKYQAALIDEFQDTDPIQYDIFSRIYAHDAQQHTVFLVGDPKQAIYSFRGGDIYTYLKAKSETDPANHKTLTTNWRSHKNLLNAYNQLYIQADNPFQDEGIDYTEVSAGKDLEKLKLPIEKSPLQFWKFPDMEFDEDVSTADQIKTQIANSVAAEIATILNAAQNGQALIEDKPISGSDIAILVRSHSQGNIIKEALNQRGIASVQSSRLSIYQTHEAREIWYLLKAISDPQNEPEVRRALVTEMLGYRANDLLELKEDHQAWESLLTHFQNWHFEWNNKGFLPMMRQLMDHMQVYQKLLSYVDGDRRLTNVLHLSELIHQASRSQNLSMTEVLRWLKRKRDEPSASESELRLESDDNLVKIVTIHKSKGLEYPIVYCPFIGLTPKFSDDKVFTFQKDGEACLEIGSHETEEHKAIRKAQEQAENTRLLYVALTRAQYHCSVVVFPQAINRLPDRTALGWLLTNGKTIPSGNSKAAQQEKAEFFESYNATLAKLASESQGDIGLAELPQFADDLRYQAQQEDQELQAQTFSAEIRNLNQITSFSGLTAGVHSEAPDYDAQQPFFMQTPKQDEDEFPRGSTAGTALHEIYENIDFTVAVEEQSEVFERTLRTYHFDEKHLQTAKTLIADSLNYPLADDLSLSQLSTDKRLNEMEFYMPLERLDTEQLKQILYQHLPKNDANWQLIRHAVDNLYFEEVEGFLKGFIDLIFEHQGKYYVADYKSNSLDNYGTQALFEAMAHSHYYLQYLLYSVALHRFLEQRISDYDWDTHVGGVYYLFIRGMKMKPKNETSDKKWGGVFYHKPDKALIEALDGLFTRITAMSASGVVGSFD